MWSLLVACVYGEPEVRCEALLQPDGSPTGLEACWRVGERHDVQLNRVAAEPCVAPVRDPAQTCGWYQEGDECKTDLECGAGEICESTYIDCLCESVCADDAGCADGGACLCDNDVGVYTKGFDQCLPAQCRTGADCASGVCGVSQDNCGWFLSELACRSAEDECAFDADCPSPEHCDWSAEEGRWACGMRAICN